MLRIALAYLAIIFNRIIEGVYYFFEPIPKLGELCKKLCTRATRNTDDILSYYTEKTTREIAEHLKAIHELKTRAEAKGDIFEVTKYNREQDRIKLILAHNGITNIALNGTITKEK